MKKKLLLIAFSFMMLPGIKAQSPVVKVYAYSRETIPGIIPKFDDDSTRKAFPVVRPKAFFIYVETKKGKAVSIGHVYADGRYFKTSFKKISTPVTIDKINGLPAKNNVEQLVSKTNNDVYELRFLEEATAWNGMAAAERARKKNPLMVCVTMGRRQYYPVVKEVTELEPVHGL